MINKFALIIGMLIIFSLPIVSAINSLGIFKQDDSISLYQYCDSCTYVKLTSVKYPNGTILNFNDVMTKSGTNYNYTWADTTLTGNYFYTVCGDKDGSLTCEDISFEITPTGTELTAGASYVYIGLLIVLVIFLGLCASMFMKNNNLLAKVGSLGMGYLILIAITFIAWNMAEDFLVLSFTTDMFRILFFVLIIGAFPLLIGAFAYYLIMVFRIKEIENLMKHGFSEEEAGERVRRKHGKK